VFLTITSLAIFVVTRGDVTCEETTLGGDWMLFLGLGIFQSVLIVLSAIYLTKTLKKRQRTLSQININN
jgi:hypothetical protein